MRCEDSEAGIRFIVADVRGLPRQSGWVFPKRPFFSKHVTSCSKLIPHAQLSASLDVRAGAKGTPKPHPPNMPVGSFGGPEGP